MQEAFTFGALPKGTTDGRQEHANSPFDMSCVMAGWGTVPVEVKPRVTSQRVMDFVAG